MPSAALQSRIKAFEALNDQRPSQTTSKTSFVVLKAKYPPSSINPLESPISPTSDSFQPIAPFTPPKSLSRSPSPSPPNLGRRTSLIDLKDWIVDDGPNGAPSGVSHHNGRHLKGFPDLSKAPTQATHNPAAVRSVPISSAPLINLESPPKSRPPLPPRKPSYTSTDSSPSISNSAISDSSATLRPSGRSDSLTVEHTYPPPRPHAFGSARVSHAPASSISSFHSVSLSSDGSDLKPMSPRLSMQSSLGTSDNDGLDGDIVSIADSYENVSATSAISPTANVPFDWGKAISNGNGTPRPEPPKLPQRPGTKLLLSPSVSRSMSTTTISSTPTTRRPRPPPPPPPPPSLSRTKLPSSRISPASTSASTSDRSSILSNATTTSLTSISTTSISTRNSGQLTHKASLLLRPTPVPPAARIRYEALFVVTVISRRKAEKTAKKAKTKSSPLSTSSGKKSRQAAGWRGLSVDLITNPEDHPILTSKEADSDNDDDADQVPVGPEERLGGRIVRLIWSASKLDRGKLRDIWNDCDPSSTGFLDREAFVKGMWRIDEELRRAQLNRRTSALSAASSQRIPHRPKNASNPRLLLQ